MTVNSKSRKGVRRWTPAEDLLVRLFYADRDDSFLAQLLPGRSEEAICQRAAGMGIRKSAEHRSQAARAAFLKSCAARGVQPGQERRPIGATHRKGRYILIKVAQPDVWKPLHRHVWEQANGPVPEGMIVAAKDGNVRNAVLENLCLRTNAENQLRRNQHYKNLPEEIVDILHLQNEIKKELRRRTKREK